MSALPSEWALQRACDLTNVDGSTYSLSTFRIEAAGKPSKYYSCMAAFARYIEAHEVPPADPVKEALAEAYGSAPAEFVSAFKKALSDRGLQVVARALEGAGR